jgi:serine/threonine protein kinase
VPFRASGTLLGVLLLGPKKSQLAYDDADRALLQSVGSAAGLALDRLRRTPPPQPTDLAPAAWECVECGRVSGSRIVECACGGLVQRASVPESLDGRLRFISRIGVGGMGQVYKAVDVRLGQVRAVKTLSSVDAAVSGRLRREARKMAAVEHANLAHVHGVEMWGSVPMLVMECLEGGTLAERLRRRPLEPARMLALGVQIGLALDALHRAGMLHRDVKPSNIGFTRDAVPKLMDFGLATAMPGWALPGAGPTDSTLSATTSSHGLRGTPGYVSPAVLRGREPSPADDIWSLSVTLYESVIGRNPFQGPTVAATAANVLAHTSLDVNRSLPWPVAELFVELLSPDEQGRPSAAADFVSRVEGVQREGGFNHGQEVESEETRR